MVIVDQAMYKFRRSITLAIAILLRLSMEELSSLMDLILSRRCQLFTTTSMICELIPDLDTLLSLI